jgi:SAM-dependent methyltransferase
MPAAREAWANELTAKARAYWTDARTRELVGDKELVILPAEAPLLLRALGLLHRDATMPPPQVRKFLQINHAVRLLQAAITGLAAKHPAPRLLDAGCGRSYLTLLLAWCARERWGHRVEVLGVDRNTDVIAECRRRTALAELDDVVKFEVAALDGLDARAAVGRAFGGGDRVHGVVALHACDTATCDAIALGVTSGAELIAVAPCCQAELARGWTALAERGDPGALSPVWRAPHLRRETAAHLTDAMRVLLLRAAGYDVTPLEFVAAEHTKKNTMIRAIRGSGDPAARAQYDALVAATGGCGLRLATRVYYKSVF